MNVLAWRYQRFHISYALGLFAAGILVGIAGSQVWTLNINFFITVSLFASLIAGCYSRRWYSLVMIFLSAALLGVSQGTYTLSSIEKYKPLIGETVSIRGTVLDDPELSKQHTYSFTLGSIEIKNAKMIGTVYATVPDDTMIKRGDETVVRGTLQPAFGHYQATIRRAEIIQLQERYDPLLQLRDYFSETVRKFVTEPAASLGLGFVVGQRSSLPEELDRQLRVVGLTHIVVASGYNLTILVRLSRRIFENHSRYMALAVSVALTLVFIVVSGTSPSMVRAGAVTTLSLIAWYYGRRFHPLLLILYVAAASAFINPIYEWYDIGWYLSFLAFAGVLIVAPLISKLVQKEQKEPSTFLQVIIETISAQIMTLPLILMIFGQLPTLSIISNALVAPVIPLAMLLTAAVGFIGMLFSPLAALLGIMTNIVIGYVLAIVTLLAAPEWSQMQLTISPLLMSFCFAIIVSVIVLLYRKLRFDYRQSSIIE